MHPRLWLIFCCVTGLACTVLTPACCRADERDYLLVFGAQSLLNRAHYSHTFAVFVRTTGEGGDAERRVITDTVTISWMPCDLKVRLLRRRSQVGVNLDIYTTLDWFLYALPDRVRLWGPFRIDPELFARAVSSEAYLASGRTRYQALDRCRRPAVQDCIHALAAVDDSRGYFDTRTAYGFFASYLVMRHFSPWLIDPGVTHPWVADRLGLTQYRIECRGYDDRPFALFPILRPTYRRLRPHDSRP
jgi:hypothetical protein